MKFRLLQCKTRIAVTTDDRAKWIFTWREFMPSISEYYYDNQIHRVPFFLSLHMHLRIEELLEDIANLILLPFVCRSLLFPYHVIHGEICAYSMREILTFWKARE